ncbi:MAG: cold shock domain-containing protein [Sphingobacteriales bacterium]|nr:MAG: cold shock domain-containing protein [Sphingobacteriales bacterium]
MGRSQETVGKKEKEKKKAKKRQDKEERKEERKANNSKGKGLNEMLAYIDENGNISDTPPDPAKRKEINIEEILISAPKHNPADREVERKGVVSFFNDAKGYGFINDLQSQESIFVHINNTSGPLKERDKVTFETEKGPKGLTAVKVKKI